MSNSGSSRRDFLRTSGLVVSGVAAAATFGSAGAAFGAGTQDPWRTAERIERRACPPRFPRHRYPITDFGAVGDGTTDCTAAFRAAIDTCAKRGGGHVIVPAGRFFTGAIHLRSRVDLHLEAGSTIVFSKDPAAYLPVVFTRSEGIELYNYSPFIYAYGQRDIAITGAGTLDGQGGNDAWWWWTGNANFGWQPGMPTMAADRAALVAQAAAGVPVSQRVYGGGHYIRPNFVQPYRCANVLIEGITVINSPMWELHPVLSTNVIVQDVTINSHGPNNDGCDPESCDGVLIQRNSFNTGDDCIAVKSGLNQDGRRVNTPCQNVLIQNCDFKDGHGGVTIGSEMSGGVRDVFARNLTMGSPNLNDCLRLKTNSARGGFIDGIHMRDVTVSQLAMAGIEIDFYYSEGAGHGFDPTVGNINMERVTVNSTKYPLYLRAYPEDHVHGLSLTDCTFTTAALPSVAQDIDNLVLTNVLVNGQPATPPS